METKSSPYALLIIDNQRGFLDSTVWGPQRSNPQYEDNLYLVLKTFRSLSPKPLIVHVQHVSTWPNSLLNPSNGNGFDFQENSTPLPDEPVIRKNVNSAFIGTNLEALLRSHKVQRLFLCGLTTDHCVSTTTRMAGNLHVADTVDENGNAVKGEIVLIEDATAAWKKPGGQWDAEIVHAVHVESLREFATIMTTEEVVRNLVD